MFRNMNEIEISNKLEPRVARLEGELGQLIATVDSLAHSTEKFHINIGTKIDRLTEVNRPNFGLMAQWTGVVVLVIGLIAAPIAYYFNHTIEELDKKLQKESQLTSETIKERQNSLNISLIELDTRLQREFIVANNNIKSTAEALGRSNDQARESLARQVDKVDMWVTDGIKNDLMELRERRKLGGGGGWMGKNE